MLLLGGSLGARHEDECESRRSNDTAKCSDRAKCSRGKDGASVEIGPTQATEKGESDSKQLKSQKMDKGAATGAANKGQPMRPTRQTRSQTTHGGRSELLGGISQPGR